jgi:hypothetical protein
VPHTVVINIDDLCGDHESGSSSGEKRVTCDLEPVTIFLGAHADDETVKSFFYAHRIDRHYEQNIVNLKFPLLFLQHKVLNYAVNNY